MDDRPNAAALGATIDDTLAPDAGGASRQAAPVVIRAGAADYPELPTIERAHFVFGAELARGGMGRILRARDRRLGRAVAIKELLVDTPERRARFEREARITARLQHPSIVGILEAGRWPSGEAFYAMKLVSGRALDHVIGERDTLDPRLALVPTVLAAADALAYAHAEDVIHRDLKPANVLVGDYGETVVIDWGLAKDLRDDRDDAPAAGPFRSAAEPGRTVAGSIMGTAGVHAARASARRREVDARADVYALGATLYHVLAGSAPYSGATTDEVLELVVAGPPDHHGERGPDRDPRGTQLPRDLRLDARQELCQLRTAQGRPVAESRVPPGTRVARMEAMPHVVGEVDVGVAVGAGHRGFSVTAAASHENSTAALFRAAAPAVSEVAATSVLVTGVVPCDAGADTLALAGVTVVVAASAGEQPSCSAGLDEPDALP